MKRFIIYISILIMVGVIFIIISLNKDTSKWEAHITLYEINVRQAPTTDSKKVGGVFKGQVYKTVEMTEDDTYFWYKIKYKGDYGWIASDKSDPYLKDINNPNDIEAPIIKYFEDEYTVDYIEDIDYSHLEITDNNNYYTITHNISVEDYNNDIYWITYIAKDYSGNVTKKTQRLIVNKQKALDNGFWINK